MASVGDVSVFMHRRSRLFAGRSSTISILFRKCSASRMYVATKQSRQSFKFMARERGMISLRLEF